MRKEKGEAPFRRANSAQKTNTKNESEEEKMSKFEALEIVKEYEARKENWKNVPKGCSFVKEDEREMRRQYNAALRVLSC